MVDMFPKTLSEPNENLYRHPLEICRYFKPPIYAWEDKQNEPIFYDFNNEIRMKLNKKLLASIHNNQFLQDQNIPDLTLNGPLM